jgi:DNA mismatch endonuclease (patch repair protein)
MPGRCRLSGPTKHPIGRSENMRRIRSTDTGPELMVRRGLHAQGYRYRLHLPTLRGKPDIVFTRSRVAIFVNGCFWHRHLDCREASRPRSRSAYWEAKLDRNVERDRENRAELERSGFRVVTVWECDIERDISSVLDEISRTLVPRPSF